MNTTIRKASSPFYGDQVFPHGLARSGFFNIRESSELETYGHTFIALANGQLMPETEDEVRFVEELNNEATSFYPAKLWRKYLAVLEKSKVRFGFHRGVPINAEPEPLESVTELTE